MLLVEQVGGIGPGSPCSINHIEDCNGAAEGLAACVNGVCRCLTPAIKLGRTCALHRPGLAKSSGQWPVLSTVDFYIKISFAEPVQFIYLFTEFNDDSNSTAHLNFFPCSNETECNGTSTEKCLNNFCVERKKISTGFSYSCEFRVRYLYSKTT